MSTLTEDFIRIACESSACRRMPGHSGRPGDSRMRIGWTWAGLAIAITAFVLLFVYCVVFAFRTGAVGAPF